MNQLSNQVTISSLEIVDVINEHRKFDEKPVLLRHDHFMAKVIQVLGEEDAPKFRGIYQDSMNRTKPCYHFPKREACLMAMSYSYELQAKVFDRMTELEEQALKPQLPDFTNPVEAARAWANEVEAKLIAHKQLEIAAPKVEYFDKVAERSTLLNATQVGQKVSMSAVKMNKHLEEFKVYNKSVKRSRVFNQWFIDQGLGELKQTDVGQPQAMFTIKGEQWVVEKFISEGII